MGNGRSRISTMASLLAQRVDLEGFAFDFRELPDRRELVGVDERPCPDHGLLFVREASCERGYRDAGTQSPVPERRVRRLLPADGEVRLRSGLHLIYTTAPVE